MCYFQTVVQDDGGIFLFVFISCSFKVKHQTGFGTFLGRLFGIRNFHRASLKGPFRDYADIFY